MPIITDAAGLQTARADRPCIVVASEGADFLEGNIGRLDEAFARWKLRHLQLTHYRVKRARRHPDGVSRCMAGLTDFGAETVRRCNALGIVCGRGPRHPGVGGQGGRRVTTKPLVLSHTSLTTRPRPLHPADHAGTRPARRGHRRHGRHLAGFAPSSPTWPPSQPGWHGWPQSSGPTMSGSAPIPWAWSGPATFDSYAELPGLAQALLESGFNQEDVRKLLGGNYARIFAATMAA